MFEKNPSTRTRLAPSDVPPRSVLKYSIVSRRFGTPYLVTRGICSIPRAIPSSLCRSFVVIYRTDSKQ